MTIERCCARSLNAKSLLTFRSRALLAGVQRIVQSGATWQSRLYLIYGISLHAYWPLFECLYCAVHGKNRELLACDDQDDTVDACAKYAGQGSGSQPEPITNPHVAIYEPMSWLWMLIRMKCRDEALRSGSPTSSASP